VARAANTGISCFINQRGDIIQPSLYNQQEAIKGTINANETITLYTKSGDFIARISGMIAVMLIIFVYVKGFLKRKNAL
jgi:apolipoprotein N-acyltransferase